MEGAESADPLVPSTIHPRNSRMPSKVQLTLRLSKLPSSSTNFADQAEVGIPHSCDMLTSCWALHRIIVSASNWGIPH